MIAELAISVEETFGLVATRLCRALHSKGLSSININFNRSRDLLFRYQSSSVSSYLLCACIRLCYRSDCSGDKFEYSCINQW